MQGEIIARISTPRSAVAKQRGKCHLPSVSGCLQHQQKCCQNLANGKINMEAAECNVHPSFEGLGKWSTFLIHSRHPSESRIMTGHRRQDQHWPAQITLREYSGNQPTCLEPGGSNSMFSASVIPVPSGTGQTLQRQPETLKWSVNIRGNKCSYGPMKDLQHAMLTWFLFPSTSFLV